MAEPSSLTLPQHGLEHGMKTTHHTYAETDTTMDRVFSSEAIALQLLESASLHSRPGQPATPDQVLPFLNAASLHSSDAAALWRVDSRDLSASPSKPQQPASHLQGPFSTPSGQAKELRLSSEQQHAHWAHAWKPQSAATCATQQLPETAQRQDKSHRRLSLANGGALCLQQQMQHHQGGGQHPAGRLAEDLQASEHSAAQTAISQSANEEAMHCCDSMASALELPVLAHVRSKPALPAEVTDDSEDLSNSASEKALQLSLADLKDVFGVPLTEAAARLGVQRQDLVRSCRRHNLEGWPRLFLSVTEAARSDASLPTSVPSDADVSDLAAFVPFGPSALRSAPLASQAHSVHTRSSSRVGGDRAHASGASTRRGRASLRLGGHQQGEAAPKPSQQQGSAKGGVLADPSPAATASLLSWAAAVARGTEGPSLKAMSLLLKVPAIQLDRPGMWAPKILQARAQALEATSLPRRPIDRAAAAQNAAAAEEPAAVVRAAPTKHCPAAVGAPSDQGAGSSLGLQTAAGASAEQASRGAVDLSSQHRDTAHSPERQLESRTATAHPPAASPEPEQDTAAQAQQTTVPDSAAQLATAGFPISRRAQSQPANSVPLQDTYASGSGQRRRAGAALGALKTQSAPLIFMKPDVAGDDEVAMPYRNWTAAAEAQGKWDSVQVYAGSHADQEAPALSEHGPGIDPSPGSHEAAVAADLMCSPFMQTLALSGGQIPSTRVLEKAPFIPSACNPRAASLCGHSQNSRPAILPGKLTPADRRTGGSAELARTKSRQLSKQSPALCLPPKKRLQKRRCGRGTRLPLGEVPAAGQSPCADGPAADASLCAAAESAVAEPAMASPPFTGPGTSVAEAPSAAEQLPVADDQVAEAQPVAAEQGPLVDAPAAAARPRKRLGRPPGSGKAARARALELALPACSPEGRRPLKKSRKALEAEQAEEALQSLRKGLPCLSAVERDVQDQSEVPAAEGARSSGSSDRQQPEQAPAQGQEEPRHASKVHLMPQTPTSRPKFAFLGSLRLPRPDLGMIGEDMECSEKLPEHIPDAVNNCHNICLNLSPPPALPGTMFCGSVCNSLLGSPLPRMDSPEYHDAFYGDAFHDLSLGNFNDIADSSFSFGCFNN